MSTNDMLPCPFCGSEDIVLDGMSSFRWMRCVRCGAIGPDAITDTAAEARAKWNAREPDAANLRASIAGFAKAMECEEGVWVWNEMTDAMQEAYNAMIAAAATDAAPDGQSDVAEGQRFDSLQE